MNRDRVYLLYIQQNITKIRNCSALTLNPSPTRGEGLSNAFLPLSCLWERGSGGEGYLSSYQNSKAHARWKRDFLG